jgi:hypothetical protein
VACFCNIEIAFGCTLQHSNAVDVLPIVLPVLVEGQRLKG